MADNTQQALRQARQTIVDLRTVLDPFDTPAKVVWASSAHTLQSIDAALSLPVEAPGDVKLPAELDAATLWLAEARDSLRKLADGANQHLTAVLHAALATPSAGIAGDAAYPMRDGYAGSTFISNASGHSLRIEYKTREQGDAAQAWLAGDAAPQEQPTDAERFCDTHCTWRDHHKDCHLAGGDKESVREQAVAWMLYEHDDGRLAVAPTPEAATFARGDPAWHRVGSIDVYASPLPAVQTDAKDAQRYRWLRQAPWHWDADGTPRPSPWVVTGESHADATPILGSELDAAIDVALPHQAHQKESGNG